jgi:hypothetical protein
MILTELLVPSLRKLSPNSRVPAVTVVVPEKTENEPPFTTLFSEFKLKPRSPRPFLTKSSFAPRSKYADESVSTVVVPVFTVKVLRDAETLSTRISNPGPPTIPPWPSVALAEEPTLINALLPPSKMPEVGLLLILIPLGTVSEPPTANCKFDKTLRLTSLFWKALVPEKIKLVSESVPPVSVPVARVMPLSNDPPATTVRIVPDCARFVILSEPEVGTVTEAAVAAFVFGRSPMHPEKNINPTSKRWPK